LAAITSGGAIPDTANYSVIAEPGGTVVGTVDEDFAVESLAGDIMLLGNTSWRIKGVGMGRVRVEDAHGAPPNIPFWRGEAPSRTAELSAEVSSLRQEIADRASVSNPAIGHHQSAIGSEYSAPGPRHSALSFLKQDCGLDQRGAQQAIEYVLAGKAILGTVPTQNTIVAERFFDESGGMQLVIHAPFGGRINRAWGLALRKRFCVTFDFELQAAATDNGLVISLGEKHSFPLDALALERVARAGSAPVLEREKGAAADSTDEGGGSAGSPVPGCDCLPGEPDRKPGSPKDSRSSSR
jgi:ATP-dependent Lhr-like helicase